MTQTPEELEARVRDHKRALHREQEHSSYLESELKAANDPVDHPSHYTTGKIEVLDFIEDQEFGYLAGNVIKYIARYRHKGNPHQDLCKARFYLDRLLTEMGREK